MTSAIIKEGVAGFSWHFMHAERVPILNEPQTVSVDEN